jgi:hypothetical protein
MADTTIGDTGQDPAGCAVVRHVQVRAARAELQAENRKAIIPATGQVVPAVRARTLAGDSVLLGEGAAGTPQVLFIVNTRCELPSGPGADTFESCRRPRTNWSRNESAP